MYRKSSYPVELLLYWIVLSIFITKNHLIWNYSWSYTFIKWTIFIELNSFFEWFKRKSPHYRAKLTSLWSSLHTWSTHYTTSVQTTDKVSFIIIGKVKLCLSSTSLSSVSDVSFAKRIYTTLPTSKGISRRSGLKKTYSHLPCD